MGTPRTLPLYDEKARPSSWNERMTAGEYAVHYSSFPSSETVPSCTVFSGLAEAEAYARQQVAPREDLRCRIYDHQGFVGKPIREISGTRYKGDSEISPRFRRWVGSVLFSGGLILILFDWTHDFSLIWPATIGIRMIFPGLILLITEAIIVFYAKRKSGNAEEQPV